MGKRSKDGLHDFGDGFFVEREKRGAATWYIAMQLGTPGSREGFVVNRRLQALPYAREAQAQIKKWRAEDAAQAEAIAEDDAKREAHDGSQFGLGA